MKSDTDDSLSWHLIAERVTHTSVAETRQRIGRSEYIDWLAYFEIKKEEQDRASKKK